MFKIKIQKVGVKSNEKGLPSHIPRLKLSSDNYEITYTSTSDGKKARAYVVAHDHKDRYLVYAWTGVYWKFIN